MVGIHHDIRTGLPNLERKKALCHNLFHLVDDRFVWLNTYYLLDFSSSMRFFIF